MEATLGNKREATPDANQEVKMEATLEAKPDAK